MSDGKGYLLLSPNILTEMLAGGKKHSITKLSQGRYSRRESSNALLPVLNLLPVFGVLDIVIVQNLGIPAHYQSAPLSGLILL